MDKRPLASTISTSIPSSQPTCIFHDGQLAAPLHDGRVLVKAQAAQLMPLSRRFGQFCPEGAIALASYSSTTAGPLPMDLPESAPLRVSIATL
ncbi:MAG: hypothetical protein ACFB0E_06550 [Leptolyngbyaceae cyanobacterium]